MSQRRRRARDKQRRHAKRIAVGAGLALGATIAAPAAAHADTFTVTNLNDSGPGSLRQAMEDADATPAYNHVVFASGLSGTIHLTTGPLTVYNYPVEVKGPGADQIMVQGDGSAPDFYLYPQLTLPFINGVDVTISGLTISGAGASGVLNLTSNLLLEGDVIAGNNADAGPGGGLLNVLTPARVRSSVIRNNSALGDVGGGIANLVGQFTVQSSTISGNTAGAPGGGIYIKYSPLDIENSTINDNRSGSGGGIAGYVAFGRWAIQNSTITGNRSSNKGGGVSVYRDIGYPLNLIDSTIAGNIASTGGGGIAMYNEQGQKPFLGDTIVANNSSPVGNDLNGGFDAAFSLLKDTTGATINTTVGGSNLTAVDPQLGPLAQNGGPTQTMALANTSPAIDKGTSNGLATDQRAFRRPINFPNIDNSTAAGADGADIGAFEAQPNSAFSLGKLTRNKKKGTAKLKATNPGPGSGTFVVSGKGLKTRQSGSDGSETVKLAIDPNSRFRKKLANRGDLKFHVKVRFVPAGGLAEVLKKTVKLVKSGAAGGSSASAERAHASAGPSAAAGPGFRSSAKPLQPASLARVRRACANRMQAARHRVGHRLHDARLRRVVRGCLRAVLHG